MFSSGLVASEITHNMLRNRITLRPLSSTTFRSIQKKSNDAALLIIFVLSRLSFAIKALLTNLFMIMILLLSSSVFTRAITAKLYENIKLFIAVAKS